MNIYFWNVVFVLGGTIFFSPLSKLRFSNTKNSIGSSFFLILIFFLLFFEMAFRGDFNVDIFNYYYNFSIASDNLLDLIKTDDFFAGKDILFQAINTIVKQLGGNFLHLQIIIATAMSFAYVKFVRNNSPILWLSFLILFCSGSFYTGFNIVRQLLVAALGSFCYRFIENKQFNKYLISVVLISGIHLSALIMLPLYFFANIQWKKKKMVEVIEIILILAVLTWLLVDVGVSIVTKFVFEEYSDSSMYGMAYGVRISGTIKAIAMAAGILLNYQKFDMTNPKERLMYNGTILYLLFAIAGAKIYMVQRLTHFFIPCLMIGYPILLTKIQSQRNRQFATIVTTCFFIATGLNVILDGVYYFYWDNVSLHL